MYMNWLSHTFDNVESIYRRDLCLTLDMEWIYMIWGVTLLQSGEYTSVGIFVTRSTCLHCLKIS
jgi:hypothetical protein